MRSSGHPKLKRRTPSPPSSSRRERDKGKEKRNVEEDGATDFPTNLLVRNLSPETRSEDLYNAFEGFGLVNDVHIPTNYNTSKPRGFGFVKFRNAEDAAEAKRHMNNQIICGNQISVVFAKEDPKRPEEMDAKNHKT